MLKIEIAHDQDTENPTEYLPVKLVSFNTRHSNFQDPNTIDEAEVAYWLSYSEHGSCKWDLADNGMPLGFDHWDHVGVAGAMLFRDVDKGWYDVPNPKKYAQSVVDEYTDWCNGYTYGYIVSEQKSTCDNPDHVEWEEVDSCWGFIGDEWIIKELAAQYGELPDLYQWKDSTKYGTIAWVHYVEEVKV